MKKCNLNVTNDLAQTIIAASTVTIPPNKIQKILILYGFQYQIKFYLIGFEVKPFSNITFYLSYDNVFVINFHIKAFECQRRPVNLSA